MTNTTETEYKYDPSRSAHWTVRGHRNTMLGVMVCEDGSIMGTIPGHDNGFTSSPDRVIRFTATYAKRLRIRVVTR